MAWVECSYTTAFLCVVLASGCTCGRGYDLAVADPVGGGADGGMAGEPGAPTEPFDPAAVPARCFADAHTIVVGPYAGCAELSVSGDDGHSCGDTSGSPVRVVRRGELPVRLEVMSTCDACTLADVESSISIVEADVRLGVGCDDCDAPRGDRVPVGVFHDLHFELVAVDDTLEMVLTGRGTDFLVRACAIDPSPAQRSFLEVCRADCDQLPTCLLGAGAERIASCYAQCDLEALASPSEACLDAHRAAIECTSSLECVSLGEEITSAREPCEAEIIRWIYC